MDRALIVSLGLAVMAAGCTGQAEGNTQRAGGANSAEPAGAVNTSAPDNSAERADGAVQDDSGTPAASDLAGARRLIDSIYAPYVRDDTGSDPSRTFTPELAAAVRRAGEGAMNADPFCDCQDFGQFSYTIRSVEPTADGATARVAISNFGEAKVIVIRLVSRGGNWMVSDVGEGANSLARTMAAAS